MLCPQNAVSWIMWSRLYARHPTRSLAWFASNSTPREVRLVPSQRVLSFFYPVLDLSPTVVCGNYFVRFNHECNFKSGGNLRGRVGEFSALVCIQGGGISGYQNHRGSYAELRSISGGDEPRRYVREGFTPSRRQRIERNLV